MDFCDEFGSFCSIKLLLHKIIYRHNAPWENKMLNHLGTQFSLLFSRQLLHYITFFATSSKKNQIQRDRYHPRITKVQKIQRFVKWTSVRCTLSVCYIKQSFLTFYSCLIALHGPPIGSTHESN